MEDERFKGIATDPRFRPLPSRFTKVKIDKRFAGMFTEKKFKMKSTVDERGRPVKLSSNKHLKKFYDLSSDEGEDGDKVVEDEGKESCSGSGEDKDSSRDEAEESAQGSDPDEQSNQKSTRVDKQRKRKKKVKSAADEKEGEDDSSDAESSAQQIDPTLDYARGVVMMSSSSEDEDSEEEEEEVPYDQEAHDDHYWGEQDGDAESTEEATSRLAIQNMDWDRIKAYDLFMLLDSFKPSSGTVRSVKIYPSEFGKEKMKEDDVTGPKELKKAALNENEEAEGNLKSLTEKDQKKAMLENLRQYQLNRLKYYYAVAEFDSAETANHIYTQCDGQEYLASCTQLDLRFIPDDMEFEEDEVKDSASHIPENYEPKFFINPALGQSLVRCTWDENVPDRYSMLNKKHKAEDLEGLDMKAYLASESGTENDEDDDGSDDEETGKKNKKKTKRKPKKPAKQAAESNGIFGATDELVEDSCSDGDEDEESIDKYRQLLLGATDKCEKEEDSDGYVDLEVTWDTGLKDTTEDLLKKSKRGKESETDKSVFERDRAKKREKAKLKKQKDKDSGADSLLKKKSKINTKERNGNTHETLQAFSDDEIPDGFNADDLLDSSEEMPTKLSSNSKAKKKEKKKRGGDNPVESVITDDKGDLDLILAGGEGSGGKKHFNMKEIAEHENMSKSKRKRKLKKNQLKEIEDDFEIDVKDERFSALYSSHLYNIDPSAQHYRKTKAMDSIIQEKQRQIVDCQRVIDRPAKHKKLDNMEGVPQIKRSKNSHSGDNGSKANVSSLIKSVKAKTQLHSAKQYSKPSYKNVKKGRH